MTDVPLVKSPVPLAELAGADVATAGQVPTADGAGAVSWDTPAGGGGGGLLAVTQYRPVTQASPTTTSTSYVDVDATNLTITFTAPASGDVVVTLQAYLAHSAAGGYIGFNLRNTSGDVTGTDSLVFRAGGTSQNNHTVVDIYVTGLTASASYTYKFGWKTLSGTANMLIGGTNGYRAVMKVQAA